MRGLNLALDSETAAQVSKAMGPEFSQTPGIPDVDEIDHLASLKWLLLSCVERYGCALAVKD
jgi:hypothetical protein